jgi:hypothetical protein
MKGTRILQNIRNYLPNDTASHPRRLESSGYSSYISFKWLNYCVCSKNIKVKIKVKLFLCITTHQVMKYWGMDKVEGNICGYSNTLLYHRGTKSHSNVGSYLTTYSFTPQKIVILVVEIAHATFYQTFQKPTVYSLKWHDVSLNLSKCPRKKNSLLYPHCPNVMGWRLQSSNPSSGERFSLLHNHPDRLWGPPSLLLNRY